MVTRRALQAAESTVRVMREQAERVVACEDPTGRAAAQRLQRLLADADRLLGERLQRVMVASGGRDVRFSAAQASMYREQVRLTSEYVRARLAGLTDEQARAAIAASLGHTVDSIARLEETFTGIAQPLRLRQALVFDNVARGVHSSLLRQHLTSVDRYGVAMIGEIEQTMATGMVAGFTQWDMVNALTGHAGPRGTVSMSARVVNGRVERLAEEEIPEGLFTRYRSWAWRIVRTETSHAYNEARLAGLIEMRAEMPDLGKKILATFDQRTAYDSIVVHGQIRPLDGYFTDGLGRQYQRPPGRPNDREVLIPWRSRWSETPSTAPLTPERVAFLRNNLGTPRVAGIERAHDVAEERRLLGETRRQRWRTQAAERRRARAESAVVPEVEAVPATRRARRPRVTPEEREATARFRAEAGDLMEWKRYSTVKWDGRSVGSVVNADSGAGHQGELWVEDPTGSTRSGYRYVRGPVMRTEREAAMWVARQRWDAEEEVRRTRAAPRPPLEVRAERLQRAGLGHLVGRRPGDAFASQAEAAEYLRVAFSTVEVDVAGTAALTEADLRIFADRLTELPASQMEHLHARGHSSRILPGNLGVGRDPRWGMTGRSGPDARDTRTWDQVEGVFDSGRDATWWNRDRPRREILAGDTDVPAHELGHALSSQRPPGGAPAFRMSDTVEFQRVLVEQGGRDALRQHGGWYVSDATRYSVEESWAEGYALSQCPRGRAFLESNCPPLLRYFERVQSAYDRWGFVPVSGASVSTHTASSGADLDASLRRRGRTGYRPRTIETDLTDEERRRLEGVVARRHP